MNQRKIVAYIATSADGYIARSDGNVDWFNRPRPRDNYGMGDFLKSIDTIIWGPKTYDMSLSFGKKGGGGAWSSTMKNYVFTHRLPKTKSKRIEFVDEPVKDFATRLRAAPGKDIWMMGGAGVIGSFLDASELDEFIIHVIPKFIGEGIPLITPRGVIEVNGYTCILGRCCEDALRSNKTFPSVVPSRSPLN